VIGVFWIVGVPPISGAIFATFTPFAALLIMSPSFAFIVFFTALTLILDNLASGERSTGISALIVGVLSFAATGARAVATPILLCSLGLLWLVEIWRKGPLARRLSTFTLASAFGFLLGLYFFFTLGSNFSGTGIITITGQPFSFIVSPEQYLFRLPFMLTEIDFPPFAAALVSLLVIVAFQPGFLLPGFIVELSRWSRGWSREEIALLGVSLSGIVATFVTVAPGYSHFTFLQYSNIAMSMLGAVGLSRLASPRNPGAREKRMWVLVPVVAATVALFILQLVQLPLASLTWLGDHAGRSLTFFKPSNYGSPGLAQLAQCEHERDGDLLDLASGPEDPIVIILPDQLGGDCEIFWWTMRHAVPTISEYTLQYLGDQPRGPLKAVFSERFAAYEAAAEKAKEGRLPIAELVEIAATVRDRPVFALVGRDLTGDTDPRISVIAKNDRLTLLKVNRTLP
jgi:hypothetical protein